MINNTQNNESLLIHLVNVVTKLTTQHAVDMKEMETKLQKQKEMLQKQEKKLQEQAKKHIQEINKIERKHNDDINELNSKVFPKILNFVMIGKTRTNGIMVEVI